MTDRTDSWLASLGFLRLAMLSLALINALLPIIDAQLLPVSTAAGERSLWDVFANIVAPALAPIWIVVLLFDYIMSRVRAADAEGEVRQRYRVIARIELGVIAALILIWVPFFNQRLG